MLKRSARLLLTLSAWTLVGRPAGADEPYRSLGEISIGGEGGWDYVTIDAGARRLYASHATQVVVIDLDKRVVVGEIRNTPGVHGFAIAPELGRGFASNGRESKVSIVDLKTLETIGKVSTGDNPDAILYEPEAQEVYAFNGRGMSATVFEAKTGNVVATIPLSGKPEFAVADRTAGRIYANIEDKNEVAVVDSHAHKVVATWPIAPGEAASGMAIDLAHHRLFLGAENRLMVMMDSTNGKVLDTVPIGEGVDANVFDPETGFAFASCGDGTLTIAREATPGKLTVVQKLETAEGARTMTLDPKTHNVYLPTARVEPPPAPAPGVSPARPKFIAGTFRILVYGTGKP